MRTTGVIAGLALVLAACGGDAGALSVSAAEAAGDGRLKVTGWLYVPDPGEGEEQVLLCAGLTEGEPPACEAPSLVLAEIDPADLPLESGDGVAWSEDRVIVEADKSSDAYIFAGLDE
jgi:hypothetical protein